MKDESYWIHTPTSSPHGEKILQSATHRLSEDRSLPSKEGCTLEQFLKCAYIHAYTCNETMNEFHSLTISEGCSLRMDIKMYILYTCAHIHACPWTQRERE